MTNIKRPSTILFLLNMMLINSCFSISSPPIITGFEEKQIIGPGTYEESELQWSFTGEYLAYVDESGEWAKLGIYDLSKDEHWLLSETRKIAWHPEGQISYLIHVRSTTGMTYPIHNDLYIQDPDGKNEKILASGLGDIADFIWFENGEELLLIEREADGTGAQNIYRFNTISGEKELFLDPSELGAQSAYSIAFSPDEKQLLVWTDNPCEQGRGDCVALMIYDMNTRRMVNRILGSKLTSLTVENGGVYSLNTAWINNNWIATEGNAILNEEPYLSLAFVNLKDTLQSFEIQAENQFGGPVLSPDLTYIAYINVNRGPDTEFITISEIPQEIIDRLTEE